MSFAPSIPIEFGLIGVVLFLSIIFVGIQNLLRSRSKDKLLVLALTLGAVLTTTVVNNFDYIPLYMVITGSTYLTRTAYN
jgi:asparagine N-glycosylation enzyme membrane subunit Stt3